MPEISRFFGIIITMFYNDHAPAHFHAEYQGFKFEVEIESGIVMGRVSPRVLRLVQEWRELHKASFWKTGAHAALCKLLVQ